jgi:hypothetical protein
VTFEIVDSGSTAGGLADQINLLHAEMTGHMTMAVKKAIEIGRLLTERKAELAHGEWISWVESNLTFNDSQARKYMRVYRNRHRSTDLLDGATSINQAVALLAEPREPPHDDGPSVDPDFDSEPQIVYQTDPHVEAELARAREQINRLQDELDERGARHDESFEAIQRLDEEAKRLRMEVEEKERELAELRKLKDDKERVEKTLEQINELKARQAAMFKDAESTKLVHQVLVRSREFFTREVMQLAALHIRPGAIDAMQQDFRGLIDLVENWLSAMKERFIKDE